MICGYIRVSTDKQDVENQRYEILKFADQKQWSIKEWVVETISSRVALKERQLGSLLTKCEEGDSLIVTELSRVGRSLLEVLSILHHCMEKGVHVYTTKERYVLDGSINSKLMAVCFSIAAEIERDMISRRTKAALARKKSEGMVLGRPKGSRSKSRLDGQEQVITEFLSKGVSKASIAKIMGVNPGTVAAFIITRKLMPVEKDKGGKP